MARRTSKKEHLRAGLVRLGGAVAAPLAWVAERVLAPSMVHHAIPASRTVFASRSAGRVSKYEDATGEGAPLLLLHDLGPLGTAYELRALFEAFRGTRPVIVPDLPGYGFSERPARAHAAETYVAFVCEIAADIARRYGGAVDVVAVGQMAPIATRAALPAKRFVRSLTLLGPREPEDRSWLSRVAIDGIARGVAGAIVHRAATCRPVLIASLACRASRIDRDLVAYASDVARRPNARIAHLAAMSGALTCDARDIMRAVEATMRVRTIPGAMPHVERPDETIAAMKSFYETLAPKPKLRVIHGEGKRTPRRDGALRRAR